MLCLVGTGISFDLTLASIEELRTCKEIYLERYTNLITDKKVRELEEILGKKLTILAREKVESDFLVEMAAESKIALLASGDPLTATTHITLLMDSRKRGIETRVIHNSSIYTAAPGKAGLQIYRFGKTATLVNPRPNYSPRSSLDIIRQNLSYGMHSLILLDTEPKPMEAMDALDMLSEFENVIVLSRLGEHDEKSIYGRIDELKKADLGKPPFTIIIPARLHPVEEEYLEFLKIKI